MSKAKTKAKAGRPTVYEFPTVRVMVTVPEKDETLIKHLAKNMLIDAMVEKQKKT